MKWILLGLAILSLALTPDSAPPCDEISDLRRAGELDVAKDGAQRCLDARPHDVEMMLELARILFIEDDAEAAANWTRQALESAPEHGDAHLLYARLLARDGEFQRAMASLDNLSERQRATADVQRFEADLALWAGNTDAAIDRYTTYLEDQPTDGDAWTNLGHAQQEVDLSAARHSYDQGCDLGVQRACDALESTLDDHRRRYYALVRPGYQTVRNRPDNQTLRLAIGGDPTASTAVEVGVNMARRSRPDDTALIDMGPSLDAYWGDGPGLRLGAGGAWTYDPDFSAHWNAYLEGGWITHGDLDLGLRLGRIQFPNSSIHLVIPSATYYTGPWMFDARYYMGVDDARSLNHTALARAHYFFGDRTSIYAGFGAGNAPDFLDKTVLTLPPTVSLYTALAGARVQLHNQHALDFDIQYRHEGGGLGLFSSDTNDDSRFQSLEMWVGYRLYSW